MGAVTKKMARHDWYSMRKPPNEGPVISPSDTAIPIRPKLRPRRAAGKNSLISAGPEAIIIEAPMAWKRRQAINREMFGHIPHRNDPAPKISIPVP